MHYFNETWFCLTVKPFLHLVDVKMLLFLSKQIYNQYHDVYIKLLQPYAHSVPSKYKSQITKLIVSQDNKTNPNLEDFIHLEKLYIYKTYPPMQNKVNIAPFNHRAPYLFVLTIPRSHVVMIGNEHTEILEIDNLPRALCDWEWPPCIHTLKFRNYVDAPLRSLPNTLTSLTLAPNHMNQPIVFPDSLLYLDLGDSYNFPLSKLPPDLLILYLSKNYRHPLPNPLPLSLLLLDLGVHYVHTTSFPTRLTTLFISRYQYDKLMPLPSTLTYLSLTVCYNHSFTELPLSLTFIEFGYYYNQPIDHLLFPNLKTLIFSERFNQTLPPDLPKLQHLTLGSEFAQMNLPYLPSLKTITVATILESWNLDKDVYHIQPTIPPKLGRHKRKSM
jgi:hypothetical protein